jgi:hypothetical protein
MQMTAPKIMPANPANPARAANPGGVVR